MKKLTKLISIALIILLLTACSHTIKEKIASLTDELQTVQTADQEQEILEEIWEISSDNPEMKLMASATDAEGNEVINTLSKAIKPISVKITLSDSSWSKTATFTPINIGNVYLLLRE